MKELCQTIDDLGGFYMWGKYEKSNSLWRTIYLGKSKKAKTSSLRARILEELKDEKSFLWRGEPPKLNERQIFRIIHKHYHPNKKYKNSLYDPSDYFKRVFKKKEASHIIWVSMQTLGNSKLLSVEADLIETLNPSANAQRPRPTSELQTTTIEIIKLMKHLIHEHRP